MGAVSVPGAPGVVAARRRRINAAVIGAVAFVVVAVPVGTYLVTGHHQNGAPAAAHQSASPAPSESPSAAPSSQPPAVAPVTAADLANATVSLPTWNRGECPSGTVTLHNGQLGEVPSTRGVATIVKTASVDLDHNGSADVVAILQCPIGDPSIYEAVGFHRTGDGSIKALGSVVPGINTIRDIRAGDAGTVQLQISDLAGSDGAAITNEVRQWRTYEWVGTRFNQTAGSTSFTVNAPGLTVTASDLVLEAPVNGKRAGTFRVTLHNGGTKAISDASVVYELTQAPVTAPKCDAVPSVPMAGQCHVAPIAPGATATVTLTLSADASDFTTAGTSPLRETGECALQIRLGDQKLTTQPKLGNLIVK